MGTVKVAIRTRPTADLSPAIAIGANSVAVHLEANPAGGNVVNNGERRINLSFQEVLHNSSQEDVFETLGRPLVESVMNGTNGVIMCYGQTGSGKSFTQLGDPASFRNRGLMPRAISQVMSLMASRPEREYSLAVSFMEIYLDRITDLLDGPKSGFADTVRGPAAIAAAAAGLDGFITPVDFALLEDPVQGIVVRGLTLLPVDTEEDALNALFAGHKARTIAEHSLNRASNRSHCIFTIHVRQKSRVGAGKEKVTVSKLHLVDLAGSERLKKTLIVSDPVTGHTTTLTDETLAKESQWINRSLSSLEAVVVALTRKTPAGAGPGHVPYRASKLTHVLRDALGGSCYTVFIANIWPESRHLEETVSTLRLASRMTGVHNEVPVGNTFLDEKALIKRYETTILHLQQELAMHDALRAQSGGGSGGSKGAVVYSEYTPEQRAALEDRLRAFFAAEGEDAEAAALQLESVQQMREILKLVKHMVKAAAVETEERLRARYVLTPREGVAGADGGAGGGGAGGASGGGAGASSTSGGGLGRLDASAGGLGLGLASSEARPLRVIAPGFGTTTLTTSSFSPAKDGGFGSTAASATFRPGSTSGTASRSAGLSLEAVQGEWQRYRAAGAGAEGAAAVATAKATLASRKAEVATAARAVNAAKSRIDALAAAAAAATTGSKAAASSAGAAAELAAAKGEYKAAYARYAGAQEAAAVAEEAVNAARAELVQGFSAHWEASTGAPLPVAALAGLGGTTTTTATGGLDATAGSLRSLGLTSAGGFGGTAASAFGLGSFGASLASFPSLGGESEADVDEAERFDALERQRLVAASNNDPTSVAFYQATKRLVGVGAGSGLSPRRSGSPTVRIAASNSGRLR